MLDAVESHDGAVLQVAGDAISAAFGAADAFSEAGRHRERRCGRRWRWAS